MANPLPILRNTTGTFNAQVLYPFTRTVKFSTTVNAFMTGAEQRWPNHPPLYNFSCPMEKLSAADKAAWLTFFQGVKGRNATDLSITLDGTTYSNLTMMSDSLNVTNTMAQQFSQSVTLRQTNGYPWTPPAVGTVFPTFSFGGVAEQPFTQITEFFSSVNENPFGPRFDFAWYGAGLTGFPSSFLRGWKIEFSLMTDADMATLESFFVSVMGMSSSFSFTDPLTGAPLTHVRFAQDELPIRYNTVNQKSTTVSLIQTNNS